MQVYGVDALIRIVTHLLFTYLAFWAMRSLRIEQFFKSHYTTHIKVIILFVSVALGYNVSSFVLEFLSLSRNLFFNIFH